jgi:hypothetical protein
MKGHNKSFLLVSPNSLTRVMLRFFSTQEFTAQIAKLSYANPRKIYANRKYDIPQPFSSSLLFLPYLKDYPILSLKLRLHKHTKFPRVCNFTFSKHEKLSHTNFVYICSRSFSFDTWNTLLKFSFALSYIHPPSLSPKCMCLATRMCIHACHLTARTRVWKSSWKKLQSGKINIFG